MRIAGRMPIRGRPNDADLGQAPVIDKDLTAPPGSPSLGDRYIVASVATGDWATQEDDIAQWAGSAWEFTTPTLGTWVYVEDEKEYYSWNGTAWVQESAGPHAPTHSAGSSDPVTVENLATAGEVDSAPISTGAGALVMGFPDAGNVRVEVRKGSAGTIAVGVPVYISGWNIGQEVHEVEEADASDPAKMPSIGLADAPITNSANSHVHAFGNVSDFDTNSFTVGDELYVAAGGGLTEVKPTGASNLIQKIGEVLRKHATMGEVLVYGAGRQNDLPNLTSGKIWLGDGSDVPQEVTLNMAAIPVAVVGTPTYSDLLAWFNNTQSAGVISGGALSDGGSGTVDVAAGQGVIKITDSELGANAFFEWSAVTAQALTDDDLNYVYVDYNSGSPIVAITINPAILNGHTIVLLGTIYRKGTMVWPSGSIGQSVADIVRRLQQKSQEIHGVTRVSGLITSESGARFLVTTAGFAWANATQLSVAAFDTTGADTFDAWYGAAGATRVTGGTQVDNTNYDNAGTLTALGANKYGVRWIFIVPNGTDTLHFVYGRVAHNSLAAAQTEGLPLDLPQLFTSQGVLVARAIVKSGDANFADLTIAADIEASFSALASHNQLSDLQGGIADEYYHLTAAEHVSAREDKFEFTFQNGGAVLNIGSAIAGGAYVPFKCDITKVVLLADQAGDVVVDLWKDSFANYPPTVADTITAAAKPTLSSAIKGEDATLTGWTKALAKGDFILPNIDSVADITQLKLILTVQRS